MGRSVDWRPPGAWALASLFPAIFLACLFALAWLSAPEHDDFCFADLYARHGFVDTIAILYHSLSGRIVPLFLSQIPTAISKTTGISLLPAYSSILVVSSGLFLLGSAAAMWRAWPRLGSPQLLFLTLLFTSTVASAAPSLRELLYWLSGVTCYVPAGLLTILLLGECARALDGRTGFSWALTLGMSLGGFVAAMCNEFTGPWLLVILASSLIARHLLGQQRQITQHGLIAIAAAIGFGIVFSAGGNGARMEQLPNAGHVLPSLINGFGDSLIGLGRFLREPAVIAFLAATGFVTLGEPERETAHNDRNAKLLAFGIAATCLACCYFEYFAHRYATGFRLVERAQNEALILLLFGLMLSVKGVVQAYRSPLRTRIANSRFGERLPPVPVTIGLMVLGTASLGFSSTASLLRQQWHELYPYWQESVARHVLLTTSQEPVVAVPRHKWTPSLLMTSDVTTDATRLPNDCIARYYGKSAVYAVDAPQ